MLLPKVVVPEDVLRKVPALLNAGAGQSTAAGGSAQAGLRVTTSVNVRIVIARLALAPNASSFVRIDAPPALGQLARRDKKIAAGLLFQCFFGRPDRVAESRVLQ